MGGDWEVMGYLEVEAYHVAVAECFQPMIERSILLSGCDRGLPNSKGTSGRVRRQRLNTDVGRTKAAVGAGERSARERNGHGAVAGAVWHLRGPRLSLEACSGDIDG